MASTSSQPAQSRAPAFICVYGAPGQGKTVDTGYSFPRALFVAAPGALKPIRALCGYDPDPQTRYAATMQDAEALITVAVQGGMDTIVIDDFSFLAEQTFNAIEQGYTGRNGYEKWGKLKEATLKFRNSARFAAINVVLTCWEKAPATKNGMLLRGGPKLPSDLPESMPAMCDLVLRCATDELRKPWAGVYRCSLDPNWIMKDRDAGCPVVAPMNLAEILRFNGYVIARHPGLPWQEECVALIADAMLSTGGAQDAEIGRKAWGQLESKGYKTPHIVWTMRDAVDRVALRRAARGTTRMQAFGW